jgi:hypothetical protein
LWNASPVIEARQNRQRLASYPLDFAFIGSDLHQRWPNGVELSRFAPRKSGQRGTSRLKRTIGIAADRQ